MSTSAADRGFIPQVASGHIAAYFEREMGLGQLALIDRTLTASPGETVTFPYWKAIGAVQKPAEDESLTVDKLTDDKFSVTVGEMGKAVGWKDKAHRVGGTTRKEAEDEALRQMGQRFAEQVDADVITVCRAVGASVAGFTASDATGLATVGNILTGKVLAFGDKQDKAVAIAMHSLCWLDLMKDAGTGFLKADATHPFFGKPGYQGLLLGQALFTLDTMPQVANIGGKKAFESYSFKASPFGVYYAQDFQPERDRDILARENIMTATMWLGILSLHGKVSADDKRIAKHTFATSQAG